MKHLMRLGVLLVLIITNSSFFIPPSKVSTPPAMKLIYVYDALCGWCYGFSPVIEQFAAQHVQDFQVQVVSGGMVRGDKIGPIGEVAPYISWAYKDVEKATGVKFGTTFLDHTLKDGRAIFTSLPAALAMAVFKEHLPEQSLAFAARLQKAVYWEGIPPLQWSAYGEMAAEFGLDANDFVAALQEESSHKAAQKDFAIANALKVQGFPSIFLEQGEKIHILGSGYMDLAALETRYQEILAQEQQPQH